MSESIQTILTQAVCADQYGAALTLGPLPDVVDGIDLQVERADVMFQVARGSGSDVSWLESREYQMRPGSRFVGNVAGIRFRNATAGAAAIVTAAVTGPDEPRLGPVIPLPATGIGDPLLQLNSLPVSGSIFGPFDVGDWPNLLMGAIGKDNAQGISVQAIYQLLPGAVGGGFQPLRQLQTLKSSAAFRAGPPTGSGLLVVQNLLAQVKLRVDWNGGAAANGSVFIAPCAFERHQLVGFGEPETVADFNDVIAAGATLNYLVAPYKGVGQLALDISSGAGGPLRAVLSVNDYLDSRPGQILWTNHGNLLAAASGLVAEVPLLPTPMLLAITNTGGVNATFTATIVTKEPA